MPLGPIGPGLPCGPAGPWGPVFRINHNLILWHNVMSLWGVLPKQWLEEIY